MIPLTLTVVVAAVLAFLAVVVWVRALRRPSIDPSIERRIDARAQEASQRRATAEVLARRLRRDRAENHYGARLHLAYKEGRR